MRSIHPMHILFILTVTVGAVFPQEAETALSAITHHFAQSFGWFVLLACGVFVVLCATLTFSKYGNLKLGADDETPQFSLFSWLAMLFAAGMGAGLIFYGAAEPLIHYMTPPPDAAHLAKGELLARQAMATTYFHWCIHAWVIYALAGLSIAYFSFRRGTALLPSVAISQHPKISLFINSVAILAVVFGLVASLSQGVLQLSNGLARLSEDASNTSIYHLPVLSLLVICFMISAATGIGKGIKILSLINIVVAVLLLLFVCIAGPTTEIFNRLFLGIGDYTQQFLDLSFSIPPFTKADKWSEGWSITNLLWWIAWAPFVGVFIARISRGRTIREFMLGVVFVPCIFSAIWFAAFGGTALHLEMVSQPGFGAEASNPEGVTYALLNALPWSTITTVVTLFLMFIFLVTSADSGSYVLGMFTTQDTLHPSIKQRLFWGGMIGIVTAGALLTGGGTTFFRSVAVFGGVPYLFIMLWQCYGLTKALRADTKLYSSKN